MLIPKAIATKSPMIVTHAHLIQAASSLLTDASALESSISSLERSINELEICSLTWESRLKWFAVLVIAGVVLEIVEVGSKNRDDFLDWLDWIPFTFRRPHKPSWIRILLIEVLPIIFVAFGLMGELWVGIKITSINGVLRSQNAALRSQSDQLIALINERTEKLRKENEDERIARLDVESRFGWRRLTKQQQSEIAEQLKGFSSQTVDLRLEGQDSEERTFASDIASALPKKWTVRGPIVTCFGWSCNSASPFGLAIAGGDAAKQLIGELEKFGFTCSRCATVAGGKGINIEIGARPPYSQGEAKLLLDAIKKQQQAKNKQITK